MATCTPKKSPEVRLPRRVRRWFGLERRAFYRALAMLVEARLVKVETRPGKVPVITILAASPAVPEEAKPGGPEV
jgi:hypothetical protein